MDRLRRRRPLGSLDRELRAGAPAPRAAFVEELARRIEVGQAARRPRLRAGLALGLAAVFLASFAALGAPSYVKAAATAVASTAKTTIAATTSNGGGGGSGGGNSGGGSQGGGGSSGGGSQGGGGNSGGGNSGGGSQGGGGNSGGGNGNGGGGNDGGGNGGGGNGGGGNGGGGNGGGGGDHGGGGGGNGGGGGDHGGGGGGDDCEHDDDHCGGGSGGGQYGHGHPVCHKTGHGQHPWVLIVVGNSAIPSHRGHGDIVPAPAGGCPGSGSTPGARNTQSDISASKHIAFSGDTITFAVAVSAQSGPTPAGAVVCSDNGIVFDSTTLVSGHAQCAEAVTGTGVHLITASYIPSDPAAWNPSNSSTWTLTIDKKKSKTHVTSSGSPTAPGRPVTFTATVEPDQTGSSTTPTGAVQFLDGLVPIGSPAPVDATGHATLTTSTLPAGSHSITATYIGDGNYSVSVGTVAQEIAPASTTTLLATTLTPAAVGQPVTFTARVTSSDGSTPAGTVSFADGATALGSGTLDSTGKATLTVSALPAGAHTVTATYVAPASSSWAGSSGDVSEVVTRAATTAVVAASQSPAAVGQSVTYTATLSAADGSSPRGTVQFLDSGTAIGTVTADGATAPRLGAAAATAGTHSITAVFTSGDATKWSNATSASYAQVVQKTTTAVALGTSASPATIGAPLTLTATVTPAQRYAAPTGAVQFFDGSTSLGTGTVGVAGTATLTTSALVAGTHALTATYGGDAGYSGATSAAHAQTVQAATTSLTYTGATTGTRGQPLALSATIAGAPAGSPIRFTYPGGSTNGTAGTPVSITAGWTGASTVTVTYAGDATHLASSTPATVTVSVATAIGLTTSATPSAVGQSVTFTATLTAAGDSLPAGAAVAFTDGAIPLGTVPVDGSGKASISVNTLFAGTNTIGAAYAADPAAHMLGSSASLTQTVNKPATSIAYTGPSAVTQGTPATFTAALTGIPNGSPIAFTFPGGATATGAAFQNGVSVTVTPAWTPANGTTVTISYAGDPRSAASTAIGAVTVGVPRQSATATAISVSPNPVSSGSAVTYSARVTVADGTGAVGTVSFYDNSLTPFAAAAVDGSGVASATASAGAVGNHLVGAVFTPADTRRHAGSTSSILTLAVTKPAATVELASSANPVVPGATVAFTATVAPATLAGVTPTGTVTFRDGATTLGAGTLTGGVASFATKTLAGGVHSITATYSGDSSYGSASSAAISQSVAAAATTAAYTGPSTAVYGQPLALSASVPGAPSGATVTITYPGGSAEVTLGGSSTITPNWIGPGTVRVAYAGDATHLASSATATVRVSAATALTIASSQNPAPVDAPVTLSATISTTGASLPAGAVVTFFDGATSLGSTTVSAGQASLTVGTLAAGTHSLSVSYAGNPGLFVLPGSSSLSETITGLPTTVSYTGPSNTYGGVPITLTAATTGIPNGGVVTFTLPGGATVNGTVSGNSASATTTVSWTPVNGSTVGVSYAGDARRAPATATGSLVLFTRAVGVAVSSSVNPVASGQSVSYTASVSSSEVVNPSGSVTFYDNGNALGSRALSAAGTATLTVTAGAVGAHSITAAYTSSDTSKWVNGTSAALSQAVGRPAVTIALGSSAATTEPGAQVTFTAAVLPVVRVTASPTGTVQFREGSTVLGTGTISSSGTASFSSSALSPGTHAITAVYSGDSVYDASTSAALTQTVSQTPTSTKLTVAGSSESQGQGFGVVLLTAAVTAKGSALGAGTMTFTLDGVTLSTVPVGGTGAATYLLYRIAAGAHTIAASYTPASTGYAASGDSATVIGR
jgi:hypothetical protein